MNNTKYRRLLSGGPTYTTNNHELQGTACNLKRRLLWPLVVNHFKDRDMFFSYEHIWVAFLSVSCHLTTKLRLTFRKFPYILLCGRWN